MYGVGTAVGTAVGTVVGTAVNSTGVLPDTARIFRIQYGYSGYITDLPVSSTRGNFDLLDEYYV